jgi:putative PIN family toxin of toxin-antitoxin system
VKAVLDTNVLISAYLFPGGPPEDVYRLAIEGRIEIVTTRTLLAELARVLVDKFGWDQEHMEDALGQVTQNATIVETTERVAVIADDPADDRVLEAALASGADVIVSGDKHLLRMREWRGIRIVAPPHYSPNVRARVRRRSCRGCVRSRSVGSRLRAGCAGGGR